MHRDADARQMLGCADTRELQDMPRADGTRRQDHFALSLGALDTTAALEFDAGRSLPVEQDAAHQRFGHDLQVWALHRRVQIGARGAGAPAASAGLLAAADAVAGAGRQVIHVFAVIEADLAAGRDDRGTERRLDLAPYPTITRIFESCMKLEAFAAAHPNKQPDYEA